MIIHKPNMDYVKNEAERIAKEKDSKGGGGKIQRYEWKQGDNVFRLLPCWAAHGRIFRKEAEHWELMPGKEHFPCILETWPSKADRCPICDAIDKLLAQFPELSLKRQEPAAKYAVNIIDRAEEAKGVQIVRFTPALYNWAVTEMNTTAGDVTDIEHGIDLKVVLKMKKRRSGKGEQKEYTPSWIPRQVPLSDDDELVEAWLNGLFDLDRIKPYPDDEKIGGIHKQASAMMSYYTRKYKEDRDEGRATGEDAADRDDDRDDHDDDDSPPPHTDEDAPPPKRRSDPPKRTSTPAPSKPASKPSSSKADVVKPPAEEKKQPTKREEPKKPASSLEGVDPRGVPSCFAGLEIPEAHDGNGVPEDVAGTYGFNEKLEKCLICEHELRCMDIKESKGL